MIRSSAFGQDRFVLEMLGPQQGGFFIDSGASNGLRGNNTVELETKYGWDGLCVEPNTEFYRELIQNRNCYCVNCCLYDFDGEVDFVEADVLGGILEEYDPKLLDLAIKVHNVPENDQGQPQTITKQARTIRSLLEEVDAPAVIDYWSLDTEGSELAILKSFPFDQYMVKIITVEHNNWYPARDDIKDFLESHGYQRVRTLAVDDCYVKDVQVGKRAWQSRSWKRVG